MQLFVFDPSADFQVGEQMVEAGDEEGGSGCFACARSACSVV
jgi:hypothetical protein